ncbi:hypothetical protein QFC22_000904 [Naganishia vaughanmartiniae]|uniref:Uncharacterized protein n=1 Tax=Naganishia vaughanmartiniae TaxID=1424756 RepID=A0ACC2XL71_9TREE|nr:hypothetical protein QFC22_000904 [Naganishia vaughanmartiniae]
MADIQIPLSASSTALPLYQNPHLITTYSHLPDRTIQHTDASMSYFKGASVGDDLKAGYGSLVERNPLLDEHLDGLCESLSKYRQEGGDIKKGALITWRGMMTRFLTAAFSDRDTWEMNAVAFDGNVYLEDHLTREGRLKRIEEEKGYKQQSYFGYSFEAFSITDVLPKSGKTAQEKAKKRKRPSDISVNTNVQWCCVAKSKIGPVRLYMGGEVDCVEGQWHRDLKQCVELKTNMAISDGRQRYNFERKLMKHWAQSYLLGVPKIEIGFRDAQGILISTETFMTSQIPRTIHKTPNAPWDAVTCLQTFETLATEVFEQITTTDPIPSWKNEGGDMSRIPEPTVWRIKFQPKQGLLMTKLGPYTPENEDPQQRWGFLPRSYVENMLAG